MTICYCSGHLLYEMTTGTELKSPSPNEEELTKCRSEHVVEVNNALFFTFHFHICPVYSHVFLLMFLHGYHQTQLNETTKIRYSILCLNH